MKPTTQVWVPNGLPASQAQALSVPAPGRSEMTLDLYRSLLTAKLGRLVAADPQEAQQVMEMSLEQAPELYAIAQQQAPTQWAQAIVQGETLMPILAQVTPKGSLQPQSEQTLRQVLEVLM